MKTKKQLNLQMDFLSSDGRTRSYKVYAFDHDNLDGACVGSCHVKVWGAGENYFASDMTGKLTGEAAIAHVKGKSILAAKIREVAT